MPRAGKSWEHLAVHALYNGELEMMKKKFGLEARPHCRKIGRERECLLPQSFLGKVCISLF